MTQPNTPTVTETYGIDDDRQTAGTICIANESRFNATHYSEPLTAFTVGWSDPENLSEMLDFIAPPVVVGRRFEFKKAVNAEAFHSETDDERAIGAAFKRVEYSGETVNEKTINKGLTIRIDHDDEVGGDWQERYVQLLLQRLQRNELRRAVSMLDNASLNQDEIWNNAANPDADVREALVIATDTTGLRPNRVLFGESSWDLRALSYEAKDSLSAARSSSLTPPEVASKLLVDDIKILRARYQSGATSKSAVLGNAVYAYFALDGQMKDEPSNIKRFVTPADGGSLYRVYIEPRTKFTDITVEHYSNIVITSDLGIQKLSISQS